MTDEILNFVETNRIGVLCVLQKDGSPHAATIHYSHQAEPFGLYVSTWAKSKKCQALLGGDSVKASFVIGFNEAEMLTLQLNGEVQRVVDKAELEAIHALHYKKHPQGEKYKDSPDTAFLKFTPSWWRFSDYSKKEPRIISSEQ